MMLSFYIRFLFCVGTILKSVGNQPGTPQPGYFETVKIYITPILWIFDLFIVAAGTKLISLYPIVGYTRYP